VSVVIKVLNIKMHMFVKNNTKSGFRDFLFGTIFTTCSELWEVLFLALSVTLCMKCLAEPLNGFVPNSHGRRV